jgi:hypothetical protein
VQRGANNHCASGALIRIFLIMSSIKPVPFTKAESEIQTRTNAEEMK